MGRWMATQDKEANISNTQCSNLDDKQLYRPGQKYVHLILKSDDDMMPNDYYFYDRHCWILHFFLLTEIYDVNETVWTKVLGHNFLIFEYRCFPFCWHRCIKSMNARHFKQLTGFKRCNRRRPLQEVDLGNFFPPRHPTIHCEWRYCQMKASGTAETDHIRQSGVTEV